MFMTDRNDRAMRYEDAEDFDDIDEHLPKVSRAADKPDVIKVSARSRSTAVAGAIAAVIREHRYAEVQAIGAGAVNQAVKALAIARGYLTGDEIDIVCTPYFTEVEIEGQERTALRFIVEPRPIPA
jgi:stage V sporulation protein S